MHELTQLVATAHGPVPHMCLFGSIAFLVGWWTREIRATMMLMIVMSIGGECLQLAWPNLFQFQIMDVVWNIVGSVIGIFLAQVGHFIASELWLKREKDWSSIKGDFRRGNYT
jgi:glycopeptide antibiotics resistance protein